ncbi:MAG TPA: hypothetical protein VKU80_06605 [Planctomycetota bacterium]|nr:hypothetical protein [Planctomycetota bacterium]
MKDINREYLAGRLKELSDWADYILLSLSIDQPHERGTLQLLETLVPPEELKQLRFDVRSVWYRLANLSLNVATALPPSPGAPLARPADRPQVPSEGADRVPASSAPHS